ncbi:hypothetical protein M427DRAFT_67634 [Gonapodya prolifera JEL478]|uniref:Plus3 domain-containing protein n=1 Tax=Gonapodya prolifera (strain JEL478) TaxID=1344416 RepID=A0A139APC1_GONPJ|nr:hypothetical protein M427DRAFT_67634 [Gonapodya prolifera JEL478]|eukprot:KXS18590.1 hypothetical protein M427DRAFT_67634 [Gonapodya prolifera JEL478]
MSDSDSDFLEEMLGGKKAKPSKSSQKKRKRQSNKKDDSDSEGLDSDSSEASAAESVDGGDDSGDEQLDEEERKLLETVKKYDKDGYLNDADRRELARLPEIERERILAERIEKRDDAQLRLETKRKLKSKEGKRKPSKRTDRESDKRRPTELKRPKKQRYDVEDVRKYDIEAEREKERLAREEEDQRRQEEITYELIRSVQVTREDLGKWDYYAHQENTISGGYVRVFIGYNPTTKAAVYRMCCIEGMTEIEPNKEPYHIDRAKPQIVTRHALKLAHAKAVKDFTFDLVSNSNISQEEFRRWQQALITDKAEWPSKHDIERKAAQIASAREKKPTSEEFHEMIRNKQSLQKGPRNIGAEKARLWADLKVAQDAGETERVEELKEELAQLEGKSTVKADNLKDWSIINERNRKKELEQLKAAALMEKQKKQELIKSENRGDASAAKESDDMMDVDVRDTLVLELPMAEYPGKSRFEVALAQYDLFL